MGIFNNMMGNANIKEDSEMIKPYLAEDETILLATKFFRDEIILTDYGLYSIDVQGATGRKRQVLFVSKDDICAYSFETAGTMDLDSEFKIHTKYSGSIDLEFKKSDEEALSALMNVLKVHYFKK